MVRVARAATPEVRRVLPPVQARTLPEIQQRARDNLRSNRSVDDQRGEILRGSYLMVSVKNLRDGWHGEANARQNPDSSLYALTTHYDFANVVLCPAALFSNSSNTKHKDDKRFKYRCKSGLVISSASNNSTTRRSARRTIVRASERVAPARESPGRMNSLGISTSLLNASVCSSSHITRAASMKRNFSAFSGVAATSAMSLYRSRCA